MKPCLLLAILGVAVTSTTAQSNGPPGSAPLAYPGMPSTAYGTDWQAYYEVTAPLPNINFTLPRTYAGNVSVNRTGHPNDSLFFVAFEKEDGSLGAAEGQRVDEPWTIWLNGGPGSSSMYGLFVEHGPLTLSLQAGDLTGTKLFMKSNPYSWHSLTDIFYVDQPVGTGYSTCDSDGYVADENQMGQDFVNFLTNIVSIFPSLKSRPLYITGESYAGVYIPYIAKAIVAISPRPVNLQKIVIGDGAIGDYGAYVEYPTVGIMQTFPQLFGFDTSVYEYYVEQYNLCGYNLTLHYPSPSDYPTLRRSGAVAPNSSMYVPKTLDAMNRIRTLVSLYTLKDEDAVDGAVFLDGKKFVKRQDVDLITPPHLSPTGVIDPWYQCYVIENLEDYATNYTLPWVGIQFDVYRIADALYPPAPDDPGFFLNDPAVRAAFHAPNKTWALSILYPFNSTYSEQYNGWGDPSPESQLLLSDLSNHVSMVFYSGNDDALVAHRGTELAIQNTTFGGIRGFTARPSTPFSDTDGEFAGIVHQERNVTYALFYGAGHMVPEYKPKSAYAFIRDFVLGNNQTGLLTTSGGTTSVVGGVHTEYLKGILTGSSAVTGVFTTAGTYTWPLESWAAWDSYLATRTAADVPVASASGDGVVTPTSQSGGARRYAALEMQGWANLRVVFLLGMVAVLLGLY